MNSLVSKDRTFEVRRARNPHACYGADKWWRSPLCNGKIKRGDEYVAKVQLGQVSGRTCWIRDLRHYCSHCILTAVPAVTVGPSKAA